MTPTRPFAPILVACCLAAGAAIASAQTDGGTIELTQTAAPALAPAQAGQLRIDRATQTMLWRHRGSIGFGVGVETHEPALPGLGPNARPADAMLIGFSLAAGERTRLSWQTAATDGGNTAIADRPMKLSLTFDRSDLVRDLHRGTLMRLELSGQTTLALKARGGKLGVALTSRW